MAFTLTGDKTKAQILADYAFINKVTRNRQLAFRERKAILTACEFIPSVSGDWTTAPTTVDAALNELGSRSSVGAETNSNNVFTAYQIMDNGLAWRFREATTNGVNYISVAAPASLGADYTQTLTAATGNIVVDAAANTFTADQSLANAKALKFYEATGGGSNYIALKAAAALAGDVTFTLPTADGSANQAIVTDASANLSFASVALLGSANTFTDSISLANEKILKFYEATGGGTNYIGLKAAAALAGDVTFVLPTADGSANQAIVTDASANLSFASVALLGSNNSFTADQNLANQKALKFYEATGGGTNFVALKAAAALAGDTTFVLPTADGSANQVLVTDGSANLSFATAVTAETVATTVVIATADVKTLHTTPVDLVAAPGAGTYIDVIQVEALTTGTTGYDDVAAGEDLTIQHDGSTTPMATLETTGWLDQNTAALCVARPQPSYRPLIATKVTIKNSGAVFSAAGDHGLKVRVRYRVLTALT